MELKVKLSEKERADFRGILRFYRDEITHHDKGAVGLRKSEPHYKLCTKILKELD